MKVNVKQSDKTVEDKFKRNTKIEEATNSQKVDVRAADKEATDTIDDDVDTKVQVVITIRLTHQDLIEKKVQDYSVPKEINIGSESKSISKLGKSYKSLVILPLTIKDDLLSSNKLETVEIIDNNVVTKVNAEQYNNTVVTKVKRNIKPGKFTNALKVVVKIKDMEAAGKIEDEEDIDHHIQNSESTSTDINFHPSKDEEDNNSYTQESKRKQSRIISQQKQANISRITIDNNKFKNMLGLKKSKRESICKNDYSLWNNTNDKLEYIYQLPNIPTSLQTKT